MSRTLVQSWQFTEDLAGRLAYSSRNRIGVSHRNDYLYLRRKSDGTYDTTPQYATTPYLSGEKWASLEGFDEELAADLPVDCTVDYRLGNGVSDFYWDGSAWTVATLDEHWNSAAVVRANLASFPLVAADPKVRLLTRLTSDGTATPKLREVKIAVSLLEDGQLEDLWFETLVAYLRAVRGAALLALRGNGTAVYNIKTKDTAGFQIKGVEGVWNLDADTARRTNLYGSYDSASGDVTLTEPVAADVQLLVRFQYEPRVYHPTGNDLPESELLGKVPAIEIEDIRALDDGSQMPGTGETVRNPEAGTALLVPPPRRVNYRVIINLLTAGNRELHVLAERVLRQFDQNPLLHSDNTGEDFAVRVLREPDVLPRRGTSEVRAARMEFQVDRVQVDTLPAETVQLVTSFNPTAAAVETLDD